MPEMYVLAYGYVHSVCHYACR